MNETTHTQRSRWFAALHMAVPLVVICGAFVYSLIKVRSQPEISPAGLVDAIIRLNAVQEPELDKDALRESLDELVERVHREIAGSRSPKVRIETLNRVLLTGRDVQYLKNLYWRDSTIAAAVLRRKGNCMATATLYYAVAYSLALPIHPVLWPEHITCRYDDGRRRINIETTQGGMEGSYTYYWSSTLFGRGDVLAFGWGRNMTARGFIGFLHAKTAADLMLRGRDEEAKALLEKAEQLLPDDMYVEFRKLRLLYRCRATRDEALKQYSALLAQSPSRHVRLYASLNLADHLLSTGRYDEALERYHSTLGMAKGSDLPHVLQSMSCCYRRARRFREALATYELAADLDPDAGTYLGLAIMAKNAGNMDKALAAARKAHELNPESWHYRLITAGYLILTGNKTEGWKLFRTVEKPDRNLELYHSNMGWFYAAVGLKEKCFEHLAAAIDLATTPGLVSYMDCETDFDKYREDAWFRELAEHAKKKLIQPHLHSDAPQEQ